MHLKPLLAALVATLLLACGEGAPPTAPEALNEQAQPIVGGYATSLYPAVGYLQRPGTEGRWRHHCSLTLVAANAALTAGHCVDSYTPPGGCAAPPEERRVGFGAFTTAAAPYRITRACLHPQYADTLEPHDLALVFLDRNVPIQPMTLAGTEYPDVTPVGRQLRAVGYGVTQEGLTSSDEEALMELAYNPPRKAAHMVVSYVARFHLRARGDDSSSLGGAPCFGDSGGPLLSLDGSKQYGVASAVLAPGVCSKSATASYAAVGHEWWIRTTLAQNPPRPGSAPAAASWGAGRIDLFQVGTDGTMLQRTWEASTGWGVWQSLSPNGERFLMDPAVVSWSSGRLDLFARGADSALWHLWYEGGRWSSWESMGGYVTSSPSAVSLGAGHLDVFARGTDNAIHHRWFTSHSGWSAWESLGGGLSSAPTACSWGPGRIDMFALGLDGRIYQRVYDESVGWHGWYGPMPELPTSDPSCVSLGYQNVNIFYRGSDGSLMQKYWTPGSGWVAGFTLGGQLSGGPEAMRYNGPNGVELYVFALDANRTAPYAKHWSPATGWGGWTLF